MLHAVSSAIRTGLCALDYNQSLSIQSKVLYPKVRQLSIAITLTQSKTPSSQRILLPNPFPCSLTIPHPWDSVTVSVENPVVSQEQVLTSYPLYVPKPPSVVVCT
jgi:hypothetical protein